MASTLPFWLAFYLDATASNLLVLTSNLRAMASNLIPDLFSWQAAMESVRNILSVSGFMPAQGEAKECPCGPVEKGFVHDPQLGNVGVRGGQQEAYTPKLFAKI